MAISQGIDEALHQYSWPGNFRQLKSFAEVVATQSLYYGCDIDAAFIRQLKSEPRGTPLTVRTIHYNVSPATIERALMENHGNISAASRQLKIPRTTLRDMMIRTGIDDKRSR